MPLLAAVLAAAVLTAACGTPQGTATGSTDTAAALQATVTQAVTAAKEYGQQHLGHYLELDRAALRQAGFAPAPGVTVTVYIDHFDVCVTGASIEQSPVTTATATTAAPEAVPGASCSRQEALRTFEVTAGAAASRSSALGP
jgi:hypothetical protein